MKIICTILFLLLAMEILFHIWDAHSKAVHKKQKAGARLVFALLLILGLLIFLYLLLSFPAILFPQYKLPENTGTQEVLTKTYTREDHNRLETYRQDGSYRSVTIEVFYPAQEGTYPYFILKQ